MLDMDQLPSEGTSKIWKSPKLVFGFILFLAIAGVGAAGFRISSGIKGGFIPVISNSNIVAQNQIDAESDESLKLKDTDADGMNDFDELNRYRTSPYLTDTDSDGTSDREEIEQQTDPNCPEGRDCREIAPVGSGDTEILEQDIMTEATAGLGAPELGEDVVEVTSEAEANEQLKNLTPSQVRQLLLDSGQVTKEQLDGIGDEELMRAYEEIVGQ